MMNKLTPREPTAQMLWSGATALLDESENDLDATAKEIAAAWRAMHDAAPSVPSVEQELLEALEKLTAHYCGLVNSGDAGNWNPEKDDEVIQARAAIARAIERAHGIGAKP